MVQAGGKGSVLPVVRISLIERTCHESPRLHKEKCLLGERGKAPSELFSVMVRWD